MKIALLISSTICVALLIYAPIDTFLLREYHGHQRAYKEALAELATNDEEREQAAHYPVKIRQLVLSELERTDRCISCHVGIEDPRMLEQLEPLRTHPGDYLEVHDTNKVGCTVCHDGQGRALTAKDAHATTISGWEKPLVKSPFLEANCIRCHEIEDVSRLQVALRGRDIFLSKGCLGCHQLEGKGGQLATDLTHIGDASPRLKRAVDPDLFSGGLDLHGNVNIAYIFEAVKEPRAQPKVTAMMDFNFSDDEALALTVYLKGLCRRAVPASYVVKRQQARVRESAAGEALYNKYCVACHGEKGTGGVENRNYAMRTVPSLNTLAEKMFIEYPEDAEYVAELLLEGNDIENMSPPLDIDGRARVLAQYRAVKNVIRNGSPAGKADPSGPEPLLHMPTWVAGLSDSDIDGVIAYLLMQYPWKEEDFDE